MIEMPSDEELPESVFVEDTAVCYNNIALITKPGNPTRLKEVKMHSKFFNVKVSFCCHFRRSFC